MAERSTRNIDTGNYVDLLSHMTKLNTCLALPLSIVLVSACHLCRID